MADLLHGRLNNAPPPPFHKMQVPGALNRINTLQFSAFRGILTVSFFCHKTVCISVNILYFNNIQVIYMLYIVYNSKRI